MHTRKLARSLHFSWLAAGLIVLSLVGCRTGGCQENTVCLTPLARAGENQTVDENSLVELYGGKSMDPNDDALSFHWRYIKEKDGPDVNLTGSETKLASFIAPAVPGGSELTFELTVSDGTYSGKDDVTVSVRDTTAPAVEKSSADTSVYGPIEIRFSEPMDTGSIELTSDWLGNARLNWSEASNTLIIEPSNYWDSGSRTFELTARDTVGHTVDLSENVNIRLLFRNGQNAAGVIGQADFSSSGANRNAGPDAEPVPDGFNAPSGNAEFDANQNLLFMADELNNRILAFAGIPGANDPAVFVIGQTDFNTRSGTELGGVRDLALQGDKLVAAITSENKVAVFSPIPATGAPAAGGSVPALVIGADSSCSAAGMDGPYGITATPNGKFLVADSRHHRVLIWNNMPDHPADTPDLVLGQADLLGCDENRGSDTPDANTLNRPTGIWSDGERLAVVDTGNNRVLIWNQFPDVNGESAEVVVGQDDFKSHGAGTVFPGPESPLLGVTSNGVQFLVSDEQNGRVLVWDSFPTANGELPDAVLGQADLTSDPELPVAGQNHLDSPRGLTLIGDRLLISDTLNHRIMVFQSLRPAD